MPLIGTLLFDADNTLINRDRAFDTLIDRFIDKHTIAFSNSPREETKTIIRSLDQRGRKERTQFCRELCETFPRLQLSPEDVQREHLLLPDFVPFDQPVYDLLLRLKNHFILKIVSNGSGDMQRRKLKSAGISELFDQILISGEFGTAKPDPQIFREAVKNTIFPVIMTGDDLQNDILPALSLGMKAVWVNPEQSPEFHTNPAVINAVTDFEKALACIL